MSIQYKNTQNQQKKEEFLQNSDAQSVNFIDIYKETPCMSLNLAYYIPKQNKDLNSFYLYADNKCNGSSQVYGSLAHRYLKINYNATIYASSNNKNNYIYYSGQCKENIIPSNTSYYLFSNTKCYSSKSQCIANNSENIIQENTILHAFNEYKIYCNYQNRTIGKFIDTEIRLINHRLQDKSINYKKDISINNKIESIDTTIHLVVPDNGCYLISAISNISDLILFAPNTNNNNIYVDSNCTNLQNYYFDLGASYVKSSNNANYLLSSSLGKEIFIGNYADCQKVTNNLTYNDSYFLVYASCYTDSLCQNNITPYSINTYQDEFYCFSSGLANELIGYIIDTILYVDKFELPQIDKNALLSVDYAVCSSLSSLLLNLDSTYFVPNQGLNQSGLALYSDSNCINQIQNSTTITTNLTYIKSYLNFMNLYLKKDNQMSAIYSAGNCNLVTMLNPYMAFYLTTNNCSLNQADCLSLQNKIVANSLLQPGTSIYCSDNAGSHIGYNTEVILGISTTSNKEIIVSNNTCKLITDISGTYFLPKQIPSTTIIDIYADLNCDFPQSGGFDIAKSYVKYTSSSLNTIYLSTQTSNEALNVTSNGCQNFNVSSSYYLVSSALCYSAANCSGTIIPTVIMKSGPSTIYCKQTNATSFPYVVGYKIDTSISIYKAPNVNIEKGVIIDDSCHNLSDLTSLNGKYYVPAQISNAKLYSDIDCSAQISSTELTSAVSLYIKSFSKYSKLYLVSDINDGIYSAGNCNLVTLLNSNMNFYLTSNSCFTSNLNCIQSINKLDSYTFQQAGTSLYCNDAVRTKIGYNTDVILTIDKQVNINSQQIITPNSNCNSISAISPSITGSYLMPTQNGAINIYSDSSCTNKQTSLFNISNSYIKSNAGLNIGYLSTQSYDSKINVLQSACQVIYIIGKYYLNANTTCYSNSDCSGATVPTMTLNEFTTLSSIYCKVMGTVPYPYAIGYNIDTALSVYQLPQTTNTYKLELNNDCDSLNPFTQLQNVNYYIPVQDFKSSGLTLYSDSNCGTEINSGNEVVFSNSNNVYARLQTPSVTLFLNQHSANYSSLNNYEIFSGDLCQEVTFVNKNVPFYLVSSNCYLTSNDCINDMNAMVANTLLIFNNNSIYCSDDKNSMIGYNINTEVNFKKNNNFSYIDKEYTYPYNECVPLSNIITNSESQKIYTNNISAINIYSDSLCTNKNIDNIAIGSLYIKSTKNTNLSLPKSLYVGTTTLTTLTTQESCIPTLTNNSDIKFMILTQGAMCASSLNNCHNSIWLEKNVMYDGLGTIYCAKASDIDISYLNISINLSGLKILQDDLVIYMKKIYEEEHTSWKYGKAYTPKINRMFVDSIKYSVDNTFTDNPLDITVNTTDINNLYTKSTIEFLGMQNCNETTPDSGSFKILPQNQLIKYTLSNPCWYVNIGNGMIGNYTLPYKMNLANDTSQINGNISIVAKTFLDARTNPSVGLIYKEEMLYTKEIMNTIKTVVPYASLQIHGEKKVGIVPDLSIKMNKADILDLYEKYAIEFLGVGPCSEDVIQDSSFEIPSSDILEFHSNSNDVLCWYVNLHSGIPAGEYSIPYQYSNYGQTMSYLSSEFHFVVA